MADKKGELAPCAKTEDPNSPTPNTDAYLRAAADLGKSPLIMLLHDNKKCTASRNPEFVRSIDFGPKGKRE
jgi:hypothetical protein